MGEHEHDSRARVRAALAGLSRTDRIVVICLYTEGLTVAETAAATGLSEAVVRLVDLAVREKVKQFLGAG